MMKPLTSSTSLLVLLTVIMNPLRQSHRQTVILNPLNHTQSHRETVILNPLNHTQSHRETVILNPLNHTQSHRETVILNALKYNLNHLSIIMKMPAAMMLLQNLLVLMEVSFLLFCIYTLHFTLYYQNSFVMNNITLWFLLHILIKTNTKPYSSPIALWLVRRHTVQLRSRWLEFEFLWRSLSAPNAFLSPLYCPI